MSVDALLGLFAIVLTVSALRLGAFVAQRPPTPLDVAAFELRGRGLRAAIVFTRSGYPPALVAVGVVLFALSVWLRIGPLYTFALAGMQLLSQAFVNGVKEIFRRARPDDWLFHKEFGHAFPSGHASTAVMFYGGLVLFAWGAPLPTLARIGLTIVLAVWIAGIPWSRMALAAHYATDVLGGLFFGAAWLCVLAVLLRHMPNAHILRG